MSALTSTYFWADAVERAVKTFAQSAVATITASGVLDIVALDWGQILSIAALAAALSLLTSVGSAGSGNSASLVVDATDKE